MMFKSFVTAAAIRSCSAFVINTPRSAGSAGVKTSYLMPSEMPPFRPKGVFLSRPATTTARRATTSSSALQPLVVCGPSGVGESINGHYHLLYYAYLFCSWKILTGICIAMNHTMCPYAITQARVH